MSNANRQYVVTLLARRMYLNLCEHKNVKPWDYPYIDRASIDYANLAVDFLGYTDGAIDKLEDYLVEAGDLL